MTKSQRKDHHEKLFIPLHTFEVLDFPVRVRRMESLGNEGHRAVSDSFAIRKWEPSGRYA